MFTDKQLLYIAGGLAVVGYLIYRKLPDVGNAVNPLNQENVFYEGVNAVGEKLSGDQDFSLGAWLYDITHPNEFSDTINGG